METTRVAVGLVVFIVLLFGASGIGMYFATPTIGSWYADLAKPGITPPSWVFGPAWSFIYLSTAIAAWLVWQKGGVAAHKEAMTLFAVQLVLNALWTPVFFGMHRIGAALVILVALWFVLLATMISFWKASMPAGALLIPYQAWLTFAGVLNYLLWRMNG